MANDPLFRLIYASAAPNLTKTDFAGIMDVSRKNNEKSRITGALVFSTHRILQILEGSRHAVSQTYNRISVDQRHEDVVIISAGEIERRNFPDWSMKYFSDTELNQRKIIEFSTDDMFQPAALSEKSAIALVLDLQDGASL